MLILHCGYPTGGIHNANETSILQSFDCGTNGFKSLMIRKIDKISIESAVACVMFALLFVCSGCFTGIEGTKKITLSREDKRQTLPTPEESFLDDVKPEVHTRWAAGKEFYVADSRASVLIDAGRIVSGVDSLRRGDILIFREAREMRAPDGSMRPMIIFSRGNDEFRYMSRDAGFVRKEVMSDAIPGLIDPQMVEQVRRKLTGIQLWTLSTLWLDSEGERKDGLKFDPVTVTGVEAGNMVFPLRVEFSDAEGRQGSYLMNFGSSGTDSRSFATLFALEDPRREYPAITEEVWSRIQRAEVAPGMTKEECRLAKGNPSDLYGGHDYSKSMLIWVYPDATTLYFEDDLLVRVKAY